MDNNEATKHLKVAFASLQDAMQNLHKVREANGHTFTNPHEEKAFNLCYQALKEAQLAAYPS